MEPITFLAIGFGVVYLLTRRPKVSGPTQHSTATFHPPTSQASEVGSITGDIRGATNSLASLFNALEQTAPSPTVNGSQSVGYGVGPGVIHAEPSPITPPSYQVAGESNQDMSAILALAPDTPTLAVDPAAIEGVQFNQPSNDTQQTLLDTSYVTAPDNSGALVF